MEASVTARKPDQGLMEDQRKIVTILGVGIDRMDMATAVSRVRRFLESGGPHMIVTADSAGVVKAQGDEELLDIMRRADMVTPDSTGILLAARLSGHPLVERVSGIDLAQEICRLCAESGDAIFLLGAGPGVAECAAARLMAQYPGLRIAGCHDGFFRDDGPIVDQIRESGAAVLFAAMGIPKQEKWIAKRLDELGVRVAIGLGGSFDVFSGNVRRAPLWMRQHGLEWAYRLARNPRKIAKVAHLPFFVFLVVAERMRQRRAGA